MVILNILEKYIKYICISDGFFFVVFALYVSVVSERVHTTDTNIDRKTKGEV